MDMSPDRWHATSGYLVEVFGREPEAMRGLRERAIEAGLPQIAISADVGRLLALLAGMAGRGGGPAHHALELGTLGGYSALWIARGLAPAGSLITVEPEARHADFAQREFDSAGESRRITILRTTALETLPRLAREHGPASFDFIFFDAIKTEYPAYLEHARSLLRPGGILVADNALGSGSWWIDAPPGSSPERDAVHRFNETVANDPEFDAACVPIREGVLIARRKAAQP